MVEEARLKQTENGKSVTTEGWFTLHASEAPWFRSERFGAGSWFEGKTRFPQTGVHLRVLEPGVPACLYHRENAQEDFFVLEGECTLVIEEQERHLRAGHFVHCPAETNHVFVGAGDRPCVVMMIGHRPDPWKVVYPASEVAGKYGASVEREATSPSEAYGENPMEPVDPPYGVD